jgi:hypothetical protein
MDEDAPPRSAISRWAALAVAGAARCSQSAGMDRSKNGQLRNDWPQSKLSAAWWSWAQKQTLMATTPKRPEPDSRAVDHQLIALAKTFDLKTS